MPRLLEAAREFNIGKDTLLDFLVEKGFDVPRNNPNLKLDEKMYTALTVEFAQDKKEKLKSDNISLPKGSLLDSLKKAKDALNLDKDKKDGAVSLPDLSKIKDAIKPKDAEKPKAEPVAEVAPEPVAPPPAPAPVAEQKPVPAPAPAPAPPVVEAPAPVAVEEKPKAVEPVVAEHHTVDVPTESHESYSNTDASDEAQHIDFRGAKIEGPNVLGKINLEEMNLSSRPKKGLPVKKEKPAPVAPKSEEPVQEAPKPAPKVEKPIEVPVVQVESKPVEPEVTSEEDHKPEHIEMKAPKLEGPKIIGRIELPVSQPGGARLSDKDKKKRKRIPIEKKPESKTGGGQQGGQNVGGPQQGRGGNPQGRPGDNNFRNRPGGGPGGNQQGTRPGGGPGGNRPGGGPGGQNNRGGQQGRPGQGGNRPFQGGRDNRRPYETPADPNQEIDAKAIQDKIRETQAKLSGSTRGKNLKAKYRRNKRDEMAERRAAEENSASGNVIQVTEFISVSELASLLNVGFADVISKCMSLGIMVSINQRLDAEVIELVASEFGYVVEFINLEQDSDEDEEEIDDEDSLVGRPPIVAIMGHVDHGKTSLLDYIRNANVVAGEAGGITQHIGAYQVTTSFGKKITFLDTPGHEAFTAMRARGAKVADIAVIVVAADDAIMPQTKEAISHAQAASLPMIFAINKIDKPGADPERIKQQLANMNILVESWGGKFQSEEISAKKGINIDVLLEKIVLESEMLDLKANPDRSGLGSVLEASLDKGRGNQAKLLIQNGTLNQGDMMVCGQYYGKVKAMFNERMQRVKSVGPSTPVLVLGLNGAPQAGEKLKVFEDENEAKEVANHRSQILREQGRRARKHITLDEIGRRLALGSFKELNIIIKGDFDGSVEALSDSLQKLATEEVAVKVVHKGVGQITESDVTLANASDAIILGFQVRPSMQAARLADQENIEIRTYSIIYDAIEEIKSAMEGLLEPKMEKKTTCNIEVREVYKISGVGTIAGCYVLEGKVFRGSKINLVRDGIVVFTGELGSLKRFKDDVKEVNYGYECGLTVKNYNDVRVGDVIEGYEEVEVKRTL